MRDRRGWIPDFIHSDSSCRMDYRQVQSHGERDQFSSDRSGGLSVHPVGSRGEAYGHWGRKCANSIGYFFPFPVSFTVIAVAVGINACINKPSSVACGPNIL